MSEKEEKFQSKSRRPSGGGKGRGGPPGRSFGKRFEGDRGGKGGPKRFDRGGGKSFGGGERKPRFEGGDSGGAPYKKREWSGNKEGGGDRPYKKRSFGDKPSGGGDRPYKKRSFDGPKSDRPFKERSFGGDRPYKKRSFGDKPGGDRPYKERSFEPRGDRPPRPFKERSFENRGESRGEGGDRPFKKRSFGDRGSSTGNRDNRGGDRDNRGGDRPFKERSFEPRGDRGGEGFKSREGGGDFKGRDDREGGFKSREGGGDFKGRDDRGGGGFKKSSRHTGDQSKPYKRNFDDGRSNKRFGSRGGFDVRPRQAVGVGPVEVAPFEAIEASPETRERLKPGRPGYGAPSSAFLYGTHAVTAALKNPKRVMQRLLVTEKGYEAIREAYDQALNDGLTLPEPQYVESFDIERLLPRDAVHQGILLDAQPPEEVFLADILIAAPENAKILVLDQVTDPHNVGAILRSAAAFGAIAVVAQKLHAPDITGTLAKAASGAVEHVPMVREVNLSRALEQLKEAGFFCIGLAEEGKETLAKLKPSGKVALVLGAEGEGLRRLVAENCDTLARLPTAGPIGSLNVSNAAAVALYEISRND